MTRRRHLHLVRSAPPTPAAVMPPPVAAVPLNALAPAIEVYGFAVTANTVIASRNGVEIPVEEAVDLLATQVRRILDDRDARALSEPGSIR